MDRIEDRTEDGATNDWRLNVLGEVSLTAGARRYALERKTAALLAYLACEGGTGRARLAALLWPDSSAETARNNLAQNLRRFRRQTEAEIVVSSDVLSLAPNLYVDVAQLERDAFAGCLSDVLAVTGELLADLDYDDCPDFMAWLYGEREKLSDVRRQALKTLIAQHEQQGDYAEAVGLAQKLVDIDPMAETARRLLMRLSYLAGERAAALRVFERYRDFLDAELGVEPLAETLMLARQIERGELPAAPAPKLAAALPPKTLRPPVLVGRDEAWQQMEAAWQRGQAIYITGEPGVGKTRLAQEFVASKGRGLYLPAQPGYQDIPYAAAASLARTRLASAADVTLPPRVRLELSRILPELRGEAEPLGFRSDGDRLQFLQAYVEMVRLCGQGFVASISDDTQYYDAATVELGGFIMSQQYPLGDRGKIPRYVVVFRKGELRPNVRALIERVVDAKIAVLIELEPLGASATGSLLDSLDLGVTPDTAAQLAADLYRRTGGNPLFTLELVRSLLETDTLGRALPGRLPLSDRVSSIIRQRLARLSPLAQQVVQAAAVLQSDFDLELIGKVIGRAPLDLITVWDELEQAQVFDSRRFSHDLLYEAALAAISPPVKVVLDRRAADALADRGKDPARAAQHYLAAGERARAVPCLLAAAEAARNAFLEADADALLAQADALREELGTSSRSV